MLPLSHLEDECYRSVPNLGNSQGTRRGLLSACPQLRGKPIMPQVLDKHP